MSRFPVRPAPAAIGVLVAITIGSFSAPAATAAPIPHEATPIAIVSPEPHPACPTPAEFDGSGLDKGITGMIQQATAAGSSDEDFAGMLGLLIWFFVPQTVAGVCDPDAAETGQALQPIGGEIRAANTIGRVGAGFRARAVFATDTALQSGDRIDFPATGPRSTIGLTATTPHGLARLTAGPFAAAPTSAAIVGSETTPVASIQLTDGSTVDLPFNVPAKPRRARVKVKRGRSSATLTLRTQPGIVAMASVEDDMLGDPADGVRTDLATADGSGTAKLKLTGLRPRHKSLSLLVFDIDRGQTLQAACTVRWKAKRITSLKCGAFKRPPREAAAPLPGLGSSPADAATPQAAPQRPAIRAARQRTERARISVVQRHTGRARGFQSAATTPFSIGDLNGDGAPDFTLGAFGSRNGSVHLSRTGGKWQRRSVRTAEPTALSIIPDFSGDRRDDLWDGSLGNLHRSATALDAGTGTVDLRKLRAGDLRLRAQDPATDAFVFATLFGLLSDSPPLAFADTTGDGVPELAIPSDDGGTIAVYSSQSVGAGLTAPLPGLRTASDASVADDGAWLEASDWFESSDDEPAADTSELFTLTPGRTGSLLLTTGQKIGSSAKPDRLRVLSHSAPWAYGAEYSLPAGRTHRVVAHDTPTGETALLSSSPSCARRSCLMLVRVAAGGRVIARLRLPSGIDDYDVHAAFLDDADGDGAPELIVSSPLPHESTAPLLAWRSTKGSAKASALPALSRGVRPLQASLGLQGWVSPQGKRYAAVQAQVRPGKNAIYGLVLIRGLR